MCVARTLHRVARTRPAGRATRSAWHVMRWDAPAYHTHTGPLSSRISLAECWQKRGTAPGGPGAEQCCTLHTRPLGKTGRSQHTPRSMTPMDLKYVLACVALIIAIFVMLRWLAVI